MTAFLETLLPELDGEARFKTRVSIHLLGIVHREVTAGPTPATRERVAMRHLLDRLELHAPPDTGDADDLPALRSELARRIRSGDLDPHQGDVFATVLAGVEAKLRIVNPRRLSD